MPLFFADNLIERYRGATVHYYESGDYGPYVAFFKRNHQEAIDRLRGVGKPDLAEDEAAEVERRLAMLDDLAGRVGPAKVFWEHARRALDAAGATFAVNWSEVERLAMVEAISEHGYAPDGIGAVLCKYSPGAATPQKQQWLREDLARLAPALHEERQRGCGKLAVSNAAGGLAPEVDAGGDVGAIAPICQKRRYTSDERGAKMSHLAESILSAARTMPEGGLLSPKEFLHMGSRAAIDKTLSRLAQEGKLLRVGRGVYVAPHEGRFGSRPPSTESVLQAIEASCGETVVANGASEANALGLTTQVPTREVFLTSGVSRTLHLGSRCVELKRGSRWQLLLGKRPAGGVIRALAWLGPEAAPAALQQLRPKLPEPEWEALRSVRTTLPSWMAKVVSEVLANG